MPVKTINNKIVRAFLKRNTEAYYKKRVLAGIKVLDKEFGRSVWIKRIKLSMLDLSSGGRCVCGQVFGDYSGMLFGGKGSWDLDNNWKHNHGFVEDYSEVSEDGEEDYDLLTYVWWKELTKLKK